MKRLLVALMLISAGFLAAFSAPVFRPAATLRLERADLSPVSKAMNFLLDEPEAKAKRIDLWATYYHMPTVRAAKAEDKGAVALPGKDGKAISPKLSREDWCNAAMQGSISVMGEDGQPTSYVFIDSNGPQQSFDCDDKFGDLSTEIKWATRHARFAAFKHPRGCDVRPIPLMTYRTIAVDSSRIPMGSVLFVPELKGRTFWTDGEFYTHDGYIVASDRGGAIKGNHIDFFVEDSGSTEVREMVTSRQRDTFTAYFVPETDPAVIAIKASREEMCRGTKGPGRRGKAPVQKKA